MEEDEIVRLLSELRDEAAKGLREYGQKMSVISTRFSQSIRQRNIDDGFHSFEDIQDAMEAKIRLVEKVDKILTLLSYRAYKIRCDFCDEMNDLKEQECNIKNGKVILESQSKTEFALIELNEQIVHTADDFEISHDKIKEQTLEAQKYYDNYVNILDKYLDLMNEHYDQLEALLESEKKYGGHTAELVDQKELSDTLEAYGELQANGWRRSSSEGSRQRRQRADGKEYRFSVAGLMVTDSGRVIGYKEALERGLLDKVNIFQMDDNTSGAISAKLSLRTAPGTKASGVGSSADPNTGTASTNADTAGSNVGTTGPTAGAAGPDADAAFRHDGERGSKDQRDSREGLLESEDVKYLKEYLGTPLTLALAEITAVQPRDPIHYLAHWLFKYRYNQEAGDRQRIELEQLTEQRQRIAQEKWHRILEQEARAAVIDMIVRAEEDAIRKEEALMAIKASEMQEGRVMFRDGELMDKVYTYDQD